MSTHKWFEQLAELTREAIQSSQPKATDFKLTQPISNTTANAQKKVERPKHQITRKDFGHLNQSPDLIEALAKLAVKKPTQPSLPTPKAPTLNRPNLTPQAEANKKSGVPLFQSISVPWLDATPKTSPLSQFGRNGSSPSNQTVTLLREKKPLDPKGKK